MTSKLPLVVLAISTGCAAFFKAPPPPIVPNPTSGTPIVQESPSRAERERMTCGEAVPTHMLKVEARDRQACLTIRVTEYLDAHGLKTQPPAWENPMLLEVDGVKSQPTAMTADQPPDFVTRCEDPQGARWNVFVIQQTACFAAPVLAGAKSLRVYQVTSPNPNFPPALMGKWQFEGATTNAAM